MPGTVLEVAGFLIALVFAGAVSEVIFEFPVKAWGGEPGAAVSVAVPSVRGAVFAHSRCPGVRRCFGKLSDLFVEGRTRGSGG